MFNVKMKIAIGYGRRELVLTVENVGVLVNEIINIIFTAWYGLFKKKVY